MSNVSKSYFRSPALESEITKPWMKVLCNISCLKIGFQKILGYQILFQTWNDNSFWWRTQSGWHNFTLHKGITMQWFCRPLWNNCVPQMTTDKLCFFISPWFPLFFSFFVLFSWLSYYYICSNILCISWS